MSTQVTRPRFTELSLPDRLPQGAPEVAAPPTRIGFLVLFLILFGVGIMGGLGVWASVSKIQGAVVAVGAVKVDGNLPVVQHLEGGLIREVRVAEGERVERGQILAVLSDTNTAAQDRILLNQLVNALAEEARLEAEYLDLDNLRLSPELLKLLDSDPAFAAPVQTQREMLLSNTEMWRGQAAILEERLAEFDDQIAGLTGRRESLALRVEIVQDELRDLAQLFEKGLVAKPRYTARREAEASLLGELTFLDSQEDSVHQRMAETHERILQVRRDRAQRISTDRQQVKQRIYEIRQRLIANEDVKERSLVRAPVSGRVIGLQFNAPGEVVRDGEEMLRIVPEGATYIVEGKVRPADIDQVAEGNSARVRLTAYNFRTTPPVEGQVIHVSPDALTDDAGQSFYMVKIRIPEASLATLPDITLQPGMPAQIMIATGEQTVANYVLSPVLAGLDLAMRESD